MRPYKIIQLISMDCDFLSSKQICLCVGGCGVCVFVWAAVACVSVYMCACVFDLCGVCEGGGILLSRAKHCHMTQEISTAAM